MGKSVEKRTKPFTNHNGNAPMNPYMLISLTKRLDITTLELSAALTYTRLKIDDYEERIQRVKEELNNANGNIQLADEVRLRERLEAIEAKLVELKDEKKHLEETSNNVKNKRDEIRQYLIDQKLLPEGFTF